MTAPELVSVRSKIRSIVSSRVTWVLAAGLLLTALATWLSVRMVQAEFDSAVEQAVDRDMARMNGRVGAYLALLRATRSFIEAEDSRLTGEGFATFVAGLRIRMDYPGIQGVGWSPRVNRDGFRIEYLEPLDARNKAALGFDMHSEPVRANAMDRARDTGSAAMSGNVVLKQEILPEKSAGFLIYLPVYAGEEVPAAIQDRRARLVGFAYAPFRGPDFFKDLFQEQAVRLRAIYSGSESEAALLYGEHAASASGMVRRRAEFGGQAWTLLFEPAQVLPASERFTPVLVFVVGLLASLLLLGLLREQTRARVRAEARSELMGQQVQFAQLLVGIVSHDLRNPLNVIGLNASMLQRASLPEEFARCVRRIESSSEMSLRMIRDLLDFTQARMGGGIPVRRTPGDVVGIVQQAVDHARLEHPDRAIDFEARGDGSGTWDGDRIAQLVSNLLNNALVYGAAHAPIRVIVTGEDKRVKLCVHNEGDPIPPQLQAVLFQPLQQGESRQGHAKRNIGLGLYIVQQIAQAHEGRVSCRSSERDGTEFTVELPRSPAQAA